MSEPQVKPRHQPGPWSDEPDQIEFKYAGLQCCIRRNVNGGGNLMGYVGVDKTHPWHGKDYQDQVHCDECKYRDIDHAKSGVVNVVCADLHINVKKQLVAIVLLLECHGGITYAGGGNDYPMDSDGLWWFGFDCAHPGDLVPYYSHLFNFENVPVYRDVGFVTNVVNGMAEQLADYAITSK